MVEAHRTRGESYLAKETLKLFFKRRKNQGSALKKRGIRKNAMEEESIRARGEARSWG